MKITEKHFKAFKRYAEEWIEHIGLTDWEISFKFGKIEDECGENSSGYAEIDPDAKRAIIMLNNEIDIISGTIDDELHNVAFHEVMEVMLLEHQVVAEYRNEKDTERVKHGIINRLWVAFGSQYE